jgi:hypothetical protein
MTLTVSKRRKVVSNISLSSIFFFFQDLDMSETGMGAVRSGGSSSEPGEEDYVTVVYNDEVGKNA